MGLCGSKAPAGVDSAQSKDERLRSKELEKQLMRQQHNESQVSKLLLLGAGESGKSTLFKQMMTIYGQGFPEAARKDYVTVIHNNVLSSIQTLLQQSDKLAERGIERTTVAPELIPSKEFMLEVKQSELITPDMAQHIDALWRDPGIQETFVHRSKFQLTDSAEYFLQKIIDIADPEYLPSQQDVLRSRVRTTGIVESDFLVDGNKFRMFDVGGQRNERKKWIHCFSEVTAVIFVASLSEYDQVLFEDETTNRMVEALNLFEEICNSRWFKDTSMILFLNKRDLFELKIQTVPLTVCFHNYDGGQNYEEAFEFIRTEFEKRNRDARKQIYTHPTCATDTAMMRHVFNAVKDIVIRRSLIEGGLLA